MAERGPDISDLNPVFAARLAQFRDALTKAGINTNVVSGYRSPELQSRLYANYQAKQAGQPLPFPTENQGAIAAAPWRSFHNYGLAADVRTPNYSDYERMWAMAPQYGLAGLGAKDANHFQLGGDLATDIAQYHLANWRPESQPAPATGAIAYTGLSAQPSRVASMAPVAPTGNPFLDSLATIESGNQNIYSKVDKDYPNQPGSRSQGFFQIDTPTWQQFAAKAGVDTAKYPSAMNAPREVQAQVAALIPVSRFGQRTQDMLAKQYAGLDLKGTIGDNAARLGGGAVSGSAPSGQGGIGSDYAAAARTPPGTTINSNPVVAAITSGQAGDLAKNLKKTLGMPDDDKDQGQQPQAPQVNFPQPQARNVSALLGGPGAIGQGQVSPVYAQRMAALNQPMTWGAAPPGQMFGTGFGPQQPVYGTSLASNLQRLDPMWMNQAGGFYG